MPGTQRKGIWRYPISPNASISAQPGNRLNGTVVLPSAKRFLCPHVQFSEMLQRSSCTQLNPLFSADFPIFYSFPSYQLSGLHFYINAVFDTIFLLLFYYRTIIFSLDLFKNAFIHSVFPSFKYRKIHQIHIFHTYTISYITILITNS